MAAPATTGFEIGPQGTQDVVVRVFNSRMTGQWGVYVKDLVVGPAGKFIGFFDREDLESNGINLPASEESPHNILQNSGPSVSKQELEPVNSPTEEETAPTHTLPNPNADPNADPNPDPNPVPNPVPNPANDPPTSRARPTRNRARSTRSRAWSSREEERAPAQGRRRLRGLIETHRARLEANTVRMEARRAARRIVEGRRVAARRAAERNNRLQNVNAMIAALNEDEMRVVEARLDALVRAAIEDSYELFLDLGDFQENLNPNFEFGYPRYYPRGQ